MSYKFAIETQGLTKNFGGFTAVNKVNLQIAPSTIYGFLGSNGSGKSTTLRMLTGLLTPSAGRIQVLGRAVPKQAEELRLKIGYMTQKFGLYEDMSLVENLQFISNIYGLSSATAKARIAHVLSRYKLTHFQHRRTGSLSGGEKQRLALGVATLHEPLLLFLDEPTSAVDPENRRDFWEHLFDLCATGTTILVTTHYMDEAERCHNIVIMDQGAIRADGTPMSLMQNMQAQVVEVEGKELRQLKKQLLQLDEIISVAQQGLRLRILVKKDIVDPCSWLHQHFSEDAYEINTTRPSLEDVFVHFSGAQRVTS